MAKNEPTAFERALADVMLEEFADIPSEEEIDMTVSESFCRSVRDGKIHPVRRVRRAVKRCVLIAAVLIAIATTAMAFPDVRQTVVGFFVRDEGSGYLFTFDPAQLATAPKVIETVYKVTYVPEGYVSQSVDADLSGVSSYWYNKYRRDYIMFDQSVISETEYVPNTGGSQAEELELNGRKVFCIRDEAAKYYWTDNSYFYCLYCGKGVSEEEMRKIFLSITAEIPGAD